MNTVEYPFAFLKGKTLIGIEGAQKHSAKITLTCSDGTVYFLNHGQECCEHVWLEDVVGSVHDLLHTPLTMAEVATNHDNPLTDDLDESWAGDSFTWTFYKLATVKGYVTLRWYGTSNGYYSEGVSLMRVVAEEERGMRFIEAELWREKPEDMWMAIISKIDRKQKEINAERRFLTALWHPSDQTLMRAYDAFWDANGMVKTLYQSPEVKDAFAHAMMAALQSARQEAFAAQEDE